MDGSGFLLVQPLCTAELSLLVCCWKNKIFVSPNKRWSLLLTSGCFSVGGSVWSGVN